MSRTSSYRSISFLLLALNMLAGLGLLIISVWFIAACAIAGPAGVYTGFNYVIPALAIRALAIIRIVSGYFEKYCAHLGLLADLKHIRYQLLFKVFSHTADETTPDRMMQTEIARKLQQQSESWASRWVAVYNPLFASVAAVFGISLMFVLLLPQLLFWWLALLVVAGGILTIGYIFASKTENKLQQTQQAYFCQQQSWLFSSTLWHLNKSWFGIERQNKLALDTAKSRHSQDYAAVNTESLMIATGFFMATFAPSVMQATSKAEALWAIPLILAAAIRDWFGPALSALAQKVKIKCPCDTSKAVQLPLGDSAIINQSTQVTLQLSNCQWHRKKDNTKILHGQTINLTELKTGISLIEAPSGAGKSSLFYALSGEIAYSGSAKLNGIELKSLSQSEICGVIYHAEQFTHVFSDTLKQNLLMARPAASEAELIESLEWSGLAHWANSESLAIWLGEGGRPISGGEQKKLSLARAYLSARAIWLLDEPFEALDEQNIAQACAKLNQLAKQKQILIASHLLPEPLQIDQKLQFI